MNPLPAAPPTLVPVEVLESPYHSVPHAEKTRVQAFIATDDLLKLKSYYPRKGVVDSVIGGMVKGLLLHLESLQLQAKPKNFHQNEQIFIQLIKQYVPGTEHSRIQYTLTDAGTPDLTVVPPR